MRQILMITAALGLLAVAAPAANAQKIDANGRCHAKDGKFAKMDVCKGGAPAMSAGPAMKASPAMMAAHSYKLDAKGACHDEKGKMAKKELCKS